MSVNRTWLGKVEAPADNANVLGHWGIPYSALVDFCTRNDAPRLSKVFLDTSHPFFKDVLEFIQNNKVAYKQTALPDDVIPLTVSVDAQGNFEPRPEYTKKDFVVALEDEPLQVGVYSALDACASQLQGAINDRYHGLIVSVMPGIQLAWRNNAQDSVLNFKEHYVYNMTHHRREIQETSDDEQPGVTLVQIAPIDSLPHGAAWVVIDRLPMTGDIS